MCVCVCVCAKIDTLLSFIYLHVFVIFFGLHPSIPESSKFSNSSQGTTTIGHSRDITSQSGSFGSGADQPLYPPNVYAPQAQAFYYGG
jgi:hypothetical protein